MNSKNEMIALFRMEIPTQNEALNVAFKKKPSTYTIAKR